ncbi:MAG: hypothetical protein IEMM0002_1432 [bacterium]|nr:MAG: hypothetical protein IEMM0002_1432 [bacterium]
MEQKYLEILKKLQSASEFLEDFSIRELRRFLKLVQPKPYDSGARIFEKGETTSCLYLIVTGRVEIYVPDLSGHNMYKTLAELAPGDVFGEMGLALSRTRTASAKSRTDVVLFVISERLFDEDPAMMCKIWKNMTRILAKRLEEANRKHAGF